MLLSSQANFNYDDQTSSSNSSGPPAGEGSSGRSYRSIVAGAVAGLVGSLGSGSGSDSDGRRPGKNDNERRNANERWNSNYSWNDNERWSNNEIWSDNERRNDNYGLPSTRRRYERSSWNTRTPSYHLSREDLRDIALSTLQILDEGEYFPPGQDGPYDLGMKIRWTDENTRYYGPDAGEGGEILENEFIRINEERSGDEAEDEKQEERAKDDNTGPGEETNDTSSLPETKQGDNQSEKAATTASEAKEPAQIFVGEYSTLVGARKVHFALAANTDPSANKKIGVLNFASAKKPGGGFINGSQAQEESIARSSTLYASLVTYAASQFYAHYIKDPNNAYYTHAMVYSPDVVLLRDDNGEWRSPVEVDVLTSAAVNAGEVRRELEREERSRKERVQKEIWMKRGEQRKKENEKAMAERQKLKEKAKLREKKEQANLANLQENEKAIAERQNLKAKLGEEKERLKKEQDNLANLQENDKATAERQKLKEEEAKLGEEKEEVARLKKEQANLAKLQKGMVESRDGNETDEGKATHKGKAKDPDSEKEETFIEQEKVDAEVENGKGKGKQAEAEEPEENQEENVIDSSESGSNSDGQLKEPEENTESKGQDDHLQPEAPPEVSQEPTSSSTIVHPLLPQTQPSQAPIPDPDLAYNIALLNAENLIYQTMYARISRILHLFQLHQTPHLILGSFGTGVFQNHIDLIASIFADLLIKPGGRFKNVFKTVVFAILGKETVRVFTQVFSKVDKQAQRKGACKTCVFGDLDGSDGDVREREDERTRRMMRWEAKRNILMNAAQNAADAASLAESDAAAYPTSFDEADAALYPPSFEAGQASPSFAAAQADATDYPTSFDESDPVLNPPSFAAAQADAADYPTSFNAAQASAVSYPPSFDATQAGAACPPSFDATQADAATARPGVQADLDDYVILEDEEMILTKSDELVTEEIANASTTSKAMIVDEDKDIEMVETKSVLGCSHEDQNSRPNSRDDGDIEMQ